jgi:Thioredoxin like C-terminal domain
VLVQFWTYTCVNWRRTLPYIRAVDSDHGIWTAFGNQYWPALYFVDAQGRIRHHQFGEGEYERSELVIQQLLAEAGHRAIDNNLVSVHPIGAEVAADWTSMRSPESYVGFDKAENFASTGGVFRTYALSAHLRLNEWGFAGEWTVRSEFAFLNKPNGRIVYRRVPRSGCGGLRLHVWMILRSDALPVQRQG